MALGTSPTAGLMRGNVYHRFVPECSAYHFVARVATVEIGQVNRTVPNSRGVFEPARHDRRWPHDVDGWDA